MANTIVFKGANAFQKVLHDVEIKQLKACVNTVNITAAVGRQNAQRLIRQNFTLRNKFTENSVVYSKCPPGTSKLENIKSEMGLLPKAGYMELQEKGGTKRSSTGKNLMIPNTNARVGRSNAKKVAASYRYFNIRQKLKPRQNNSKMALAVAAYNAAKDKGFIRINDTIFQVLKFKPDNRLFSSRPILNLKHQSVQIHAEPWMAPAADYARKLMQDIYNREMDKL